MRRCVLCRNPDAPAELHGLRAVGLSHDETKALKSGNKIEHVVGTSAPMLEVFDQVHQVAPALTTVLLRGESGTGDSRPADLDALDSGFGAPLAPSADGSATEPHVADKLEGERARLVWATERCGWVQAKAARLLKITPRQMGYALQKHGIEVRKF